MARDSFHSKSSTGKIAATARGGNANPALRNIPVDACVPFYAETSNLQQQLLQVYRTVVLCVRKEEKMERVAGWWQMMVEVCDKFGGCLHALTQEHPYCGAGMFYDAVLDLRNRCLRLKEMHG